MNRIALWRAPAWRLALVLLTALFFSVSAQARRGGGPGGGGGGGQGAVPAGSVVVRATLTAVDATAGTIQIADRNGLTATLKTTTSTVIRRAAMEVWAMQTCSG